MGLMIRLFGMVCGSLLWLHAMVPAASAADIVWLADLDLTKIKQGWGSPRKDLSVSGKPISIGGKRYERGLGTHSVSEILVHLGRGVKRFSSSVGVDDACGGKGSVVFKLFGDGKRLFDSGLMKPGDAAKQVDLDLQGVKVLVLAVDDGGDGIFFDHADWADAHFIVGIAKPETVDAPEIPEFILTPKPGREPKINGPAVYGCRPGNWFLYRVPATGERPMEFSAEGLPESLHLDKETGIISGDAPLRGEHKITLRAKNDHGEASRVLRVISGDKLALTPPMGWNSWYVHYMKATDEKLRKAADVMIRSGMADVGYQYVNIDDSWGNAKEGDHKDDPLRIGPGRDGEGNILPNKHFPDMKALTDYIHTKGLKAGIYTSPGPKTCCKFEGAWKHEAKDAQRFVEWGFDFLKYDWCSYGFVAGKKPGFVANKDLTLEEMKRPYVLMGDILREQERDVVYNLCQYGMGKVWEWGAEVGGHCWRTAGDLGVELPAFFQVALRNAEHRQWSKPGEWNDPDYLMIGYTGEADGNHSKFGLNPNEQYSYMSLWCLMAAPLFFSGNMELLDEFTLNILCNPEVIEVDQDPLGRCAEVIKKDADTFLMVKEMEDGSKAVGLFNMNRFFEAEVTMDWKDAGLQDKQRVRDLWRQKDFGIFEGNLKMTVSPRGVVLVRVWPEE